MTTKTHDNDYHFIEVIIALTSILITTLLSCFIPSPHKSLNKSLATSPSPKKKGRSSSKRTSPTIQVSSTPKTKTRTRSTAVSTSTRKASTGATGNPSAAKKNSKDGTMSRPTRKSRSGRSIPSVSPQVMTK